ncbi:MAG: hypothetical protein IKM00_10975 [Clostridia bacterium]|nr:hypothetical protein [Clostridia bacterium]
MSQNNHYIAITIGPIGDMMGLVRKPTALWGASYIFSYISKRLCELIVEKKVAASSDIITPFFVAEKDAKNENEKSLMDRRDGVGLFHDHIIVRADLSKNREVMKEIKREVIENVASILAPENCDTPEKQKAYADQIEKYILIAVCGFEKDGTGNATMYCGKQLDSLELPKQFAAAEEKHPILSRLQSRRDNDASATIKTIAERFGVDMKQWQLTLEKNSGRDVRDLPDIAAASRAPGFKKNKYYCILRADGDNMSKIISGLPDDEKCREFSRICLDYCAKVAAAVKTYGGATIFAGGDDLFAIVPCQGVDPETGKMITVLEFTQSICKIFRASFRKEIEAIEKANLNQPENKRVPVPSLSFGAYICYRKFPLYEAIERSGALLFGVAKNTAHKNCVAVHLQKHAGQSEELVISNTVLADESNRFFERFNFLISNSKDQDEILLSVSNKILLFNHLLAAAPSENVKNVFENVFDDDFHTDKRSDFLHVFLPDMYEICRKPDQIVLYERDRALKTADPAKTLAQLIRFMKFFVEKGDM